MALALNTTAFQEPRGVMRLIQFLFAICAFATTSGFSNTLTLAFCGTEQQTIEYGYPFHLGHISKEFTCKNFNGTISLIGDFSSDSQFFVATGVLSFLYCIGIVVVYALYENIYQSNSLVPMADFILTVLLAVFWLSGSAAWSNGVAGLKNLTSPDYLKSSIACSADKLNCTNVYSGSYSNLNVSIIFGFLNFFLWAADLWFLYKETPWFKGNNPIPATSPGVSA